MSEPKGKLIAIGGSEDKGTDLEKGEIHRNNLNFFESNDAFHRLRWAFVSGALSMIFFSVASLTIAVIFKEATKTWIVSAFFLIFSNILLKVEFRNYWFNR